MPQSQTCSFQEHPAWLCLPSIAKLLSGAASEAHALGHHSLTNRLASAPGKTYAAN
jgi:hypothetical protein